MPCWKLLLCISFCSTLGRADLLFDMIQEAERNIERQYRTTVAKETAIKTLREILENGNGNDKLLRIESTFIRPKSGPLTQDNAYRLLLSPDLDWTVHSIDIAGTVKGNDTIILTQKRQKKREQVAKGSKISSVQFSDVSELTRQTSLKGGAEVQISFNPIDFLVPKIYFSALAEASKKGIETSTSQGTWSRDWQDSSSAHDEFTKEIQSNTNISDYHLVFAITFKNNSSSDLSFDSDSTIPVYCGNEFLLNAAPVKNGDKSEFLLPANGTTTIQCKGLLDNTRSRELLANENFRSDLHICPEQGQFFIHSADGLKNNLLQCPNVPTVSLACHGIKWNLQKTWDDRSVTLREAIWAINSLYADPVFDIQDENHITIFGKPLFFQEDHFDFTSETVLLKQRNRIIPSLGSKGLDGVLDSDIDILVIKDVASFLLFAEATREQKLDFLDAAEKKFRCDDASTQWFLGFIYASLGDCWEKVIKWYGKAAEQGYAPAQNELGGCYYYGYGGERDFKKAVEWVERAAEQEFAAAQFNLGVCYRNGEGVEKDFAKAAEWFAKAAEHGFAPGQCVLGACYRDGAGVEKDFAKAAEWYRKAAGQGYAVAQNVLGGCYHDGEGVEKDFAKAVEWFERAAEQELAAAQFNLGGCYYYGEGVEKDFAKAAEWYRKAADQGDAVAQCALGVCYHNGEGVEKDLEKAAEWFAKAAEQGFAQGQCVLGECYRDGDGVERDFKKAAEWFAKAAEQGFSAAQNNLGECYKKGKGLPKDKKKAEEWFQKAREGNAW